MHVVALSVGDPERRIRIGEEPGERCANPPVRQDPANEVPAPGVAILPMRGFLRVKLADGRVSVEGPGVHELEEGQDVASAVGGSKDMGIGKAVADAVDQPGRFLPAPGHGDKQVDPDVERHQPICEFVPEVGVVDMDMQGIGVMPGCGIDSPLRLGHARQPWYGVFAMRATLRPAEPQEMLQRSETRTRHVGMQVKIGLGVELRAGPEAGCLPPQDVVAHRERAIQAVQARIGPPIEVCVEQAASLQHPKVGQRGRPQKEQTGHFAAPREKKSCT